MPLLSIDQGTTGTTVLLIDHDGRVMARAAREFPQLYPRPGWVEHDPEAIWHSVQAAVAEVLKQHAGPVRAIGITNQRETTVLWNRRSGAPLHNAIVWQCRRTTDICARLREHEAWVRQKTGLPLDPYFSGTKIRWLLEHADLPATDDIAFGTVDSWLIWKLTGGATHATDVTNASRTLLMDITTQAWDADLCDLFGVPMHILPETRPSAGEFGTVSALPQLQGVPILGVAGDQQAALFGQGCFATGQVKNTYGTGCFLLMNTGQTLVRSKHGLLSTLAINAEGRPCYALEGAVFVAGAAIQWLRDELAILESAAASEAAARALPDNEGVYLVPAFVGLGAPHWAPEARGLLTGLTRGTGRNHIIRAALESMAYQTVDVLDAMERDTDLRLACLAVDGGAAANDFLMQLQADLLDRPVVRPGNIETTALGAAALAGLASGLWTTEDIQRIQKRQGTTFTQKMACDERVRLLDGWHRALRQALQT